MGKRKQECPRKLAETGTIGTSEVSKLEDIVKKLKTNSFVTPSKSPVPVAPFTIAVESFKAAFSSSTQSHDCPNVMIPVLPTTVDLHACRSLPPQKRTEQQHNHCNDFQPLDLRVPKMPTNKRNSPVPTSRLMSSGNFSLTTPVSSHASVTPSNPTTVRSSTPVLRHRSDTPTKTVLQHQPITTTAPKPTAPATSFQELSAKLEQYFNTGIAASKFPRKMVRGQDMWMQDIEQKRRILKCLKCGCSYNTLAELAKHIKKTGHHTSELPAFSPETQRNHPVYSRLTGMRQERHSASHSDIPLNGAVHSHSTHDEEKNSRGPSAFRPVHLTSSASDQKAKDQNCHQGLYLSSSSLNHIRHSKSGIRDFQSNNNNHSSEVRRPRHSVEDMLNNESNGHNGFFHGACVMRDKDARRSSGSCRQEREKPSRSEYLAEKTARCSKVLQKDISPTVTGNMAVKTERSESPIKMERNDKAEEKALLAPTAPANNSSQEITCSPLFALKKFIDHGIPRLKPAGIDGGRI